VIDQEPTPAFFRQDPAGLPEPAKSIGDRAVLYLIRRLEELYRRRARVSLRVYVELLTVAGHCGYAVERLAEAGRRGYSREQLTRHRRN
jgi:hypothetical protein